MIGNKGAISQIGTGMVKITRNMSSKFHLSFNSVYVFMVSGFSPAAGQKKRPV